MSLFYTKILLQRLWKLHRLQYESWVYVQLKFGIRIHLKNTYLKPKSGIADNILHDIIKL